MSTIMTTGSLRPLSDDSLSFDETSLSLHPIMVMEDRCGGVYSGGKWLAISVADRLENGAYRAVRMLEGGPSGDDVDAQMFWSEPPGWVAVGSTPDEAVAQLRDASDKRRRRELDGRIADGLKSLDEGRSFSAEEVMGRLEARFARMASAAE